MGSCKFSVHPIILASDFGWSENFRCPENGDNRQRLRFWLIFSLSTIKLGHSCAWSQSILAVAIQVAWVFGTTQVWLWPFWASKSCRIFSFRWRQAKTRNPADRLERNKRIPTIIDPRPLRMRWSWHLPWTLDQVGSGWIQWWHVSPSRSHFIQGTSSRIRIHRNPDLKQLQMDLIDRKWWQIHDTAELGLPKNGNQ